MNEREAARLVDYGRTRVTAQVGDQSLRGVAVSVQLLPVMTFRTPEGVTVTAPLEDCEITD